MLVWLAKRRDSWGFKGVFCRVMPVEEEWISVSDNEQLLIVNYRSIEADPSR